MRLAYEPAFECSFEAASYGFRPGRSCQDAIEDIFQKLKKGSNNEWVLDTDIKGAFDNILHEFIMKKIEGLPGRQIIHKWLRAGHVENGVHHATEAGTPQGGLISPLLANIALDGLEELLSQFKETVKYRTKMRGKDYMRPRKINKFQFIRYADDMVILSPRKEWLQEVVPFVKNWLAKRGLYLNEEKTSICNVREEGFSFLGFDIRQFKGQTLREGSKEYRRIINGGLPKGSKGERAKSKSNSRRSRTTPVAKHKEEEVFSCVIKPGKKEVTGFLRHIGNLIKNSTSLTFEQLIRILNPKLRGWANYYRYVVSKKTFSKVRNFVLEAIWRFLKRRHPQKGIKWIRKKYFTTVDNDNYVPFSQYVNRKGKKTIIKLVNIAKDIPIVRFVKVKGANSPFDPDLQDYWSKRNHSQGKTRFAKGSKLERIYNREKGICPICGENITLEDDFELHHIKPIKDGGTNSEDNLVFLHKQCHKSKHKKLHYDLVDNAIDNAVKSEKSKENGC